MFSAVASWLQAGEEAVNNLAKRSGFGLEPAQTTADAAADAEGSAVVAAAETHPDAPLDQPPAEGSFWRSPPPHWQDSAAEWKTVAAAVLRDENTFLIAPQRALAHGPTAVLLESCPRVAVLVSEVNRSASTVDAAAAAGDGKAQTANEALWVAALLEAPGLSELRYRLVPALVSDNNFWRNGVWRVRVLRRMDNTEAAVAVLRAVNTERSEPPPTDPADTVKGASPPPRLRNVGNFTNGEFWDKVEAAARQQRELHDAAAIKRDTCAAEITSCRSNLQLLRSITSTNDPDKLELADSVRDSLEFHKVKLGAHISDLDTMAANSAAADRDGDMTSPVTMSAVCPELAVPDGELYTSLIAVNGEIQLMLREYTAWRDRCSAAVAARDDEDEARNRGRSAGEAATIAAVASTALAHGIDRGGSDSQVADSGASPARRHPTGSSPSDPTDRNADDAFTANVPWDDDDDDDLDDF